MKPILLIYSAICLFCLSSCTGSRLSWSNGDPDGNVAYQPVTTLSGKTPKGTGIVKNGKYHGYSTPQAYYEDYDRHNRVNGY